MQNIDLNSSLTTGGSGMIGSYINFGYKPTSTELNITLLSSINNYLQNKEISCIIHLVALNLRDSEKNIKKTIDININGTINMLNVAKKLNIPFILLSTGAVFSSFNSNIKFDENFDTCPNCIYGYTKSSAEKIALTYNNAIIIRTGWLFGGNQKTHYKFVENVINNLIIDTEIKASNDFYGSPTYVGDLIEQIKFLILNNKYGIHHIINDGIATGFDIAYEIAEILNKPIEKITSLNSEEIPNSGPLRSKTEILESIYEFNKLRHWKLSLKEYVLKYIETKNIQINNTINEKSISIWNNRDKCRLCNNYNINVFFNLEPSPLANNFVLIPQKQELIPLDICICNECKHIQLLQIVNPNLQYINYLYVSSTSNTMVNHLKSNVLNFVNVLNLQNTDYILEIGANDGVCVKYLLENGFNNVVGIDPAKNINKRHNLPIICDFFNTNSGEYLKQNYQPFKLIYAFHCCAHIEDINNVFETVYDILDENGTFIIEVGYFYKVFANYLFDTIYHEHIDYHTCFSMKKFAERKNFKLYNVNQNDIQGGSIQFYFCKTINTNININNSVNETIQEELRVELHNFNNLSNWKNKIIMCGNDINYILNSFINYGKKIAGYGASAKSTTFLHQYKISNKLINYIIDDSIYKQNYYTPALNIPIKPLNYLEIEKVDYIIILSWNFTKEIVDNLELYRKNGLRIIIPFPEIKII